MKVQTFFAGRCTTTGTDAGTPRRPSGTTACGSGGVDPASCPSGTVCANGCCLQDITIGAVTS